MVDFAALSKRRVVSRPSVALLLLAQAVGCGRGKTAATLTPAETLDGVLAPANLVASLRRAGGGHYHATTTLRADLAAPPAVDTGKPVAPSTITTTTDVWMDGAGNFRLVESNDQDGGREIVRAGGDIAVALRYGKLMRRPAQDAESNRLLAEALGGPWTAWELVRRQVDVQAETGAGFRLRLGKRQPELPAGFPASEGLRAWRGSIEVKAVDGQLKLDSSSHLVPAMACKATFAAQRDQVPIAGEVAVTATLEQVGQVPAITMPEAEALRTRQRTILEERALLGGVTAGAGRAEKAP
jgi:hypothetical protein